MDERREIFRVYIELCKHGSQPISDQNSQMLCYNKVYKICKLVSSLQADIFHVL